MNTFDLRQHTHLLTLGGSRAYGLARPDSDVDVKGFAIPPKAWFLGFLRSFDQADSPEEIGVFRELLRPDERAVVDNTKLEGSVYNLRKFAHLAMDGNPHMIDILFCRDEEVRFCSPLGEHLRRNREMFLSRRIRHSFGGYAASQLKRIEGHRRWLLNPPKGAPLRADYGLPEHTLIPRDQLAAAEAAVRTKIDSWELDLSGLPKSTIQHVLDGVEATLVEIGCNLDAKYAAAARSIGLDENFVALMERERKYKRAAQEWRQYEGWRQNRNQARSELETRFGYDTKHGAHLVRLLRMAHEILTTGKVSVWRGGLDAEELQSIRDGAWSYDQLLDWTKAREEELRQLDKAPVAVPETPDREELEQLIRWTVEGSFTLAWDRQTGKPLLGLEHHLTKAFVP